MGRSLLWFTLLGRRPAFDCRIGCDVRQVAALGRTIGLVPLGLALGFGALELVRDSLGLFLILLGRDRAVDPVRSLDFRGVRGKGPGSAQRSDGEQVVESGGQRGRDRGVCRERSVDVGRSVRLGRRFRRTAVRLVLSHEIGLGRRHDSRLA